MHVAANSLVVPLIIISGNSYNNNIIAFTILIISVNMWLCKYKNSTLAVQSERQAEAS